MRNLFHLLLAAAALLACPGYSASNPQNGSLSFYLVSDVKLEGGRYIDTVEFPKLGYIAAQPDLVVTQLVAVRETVTHPFMLTPGKDGALAQTPLPDRPALEIQILPKDSQQLEALTQDNIGKQMLMMVDGMPLIAPRINSPIATQTFQLTAGNQKVIEDALKKLVH